MALKGMWWERAGGFGREVGTITGRRNWRKDQARKLSVGVNHKTEKEMAEDTGMRTVGRE